MAGDTKTTAFKSPRQAREEREMTAFNGITGDLAVLPARGISESTCKIGDVTLTQWTFLCEDREDCYAVGYSKKSAESAKAQVIGKHVCPAPMRYSVLPTGKTITEKLWDTGDIALRAFKEGGYYPTPEMTGERLMGYIGGVAEAIAMFTDPYFRHQKDVLIELQRRWRMHTGDIPFSPTPSYRFNPPIEVWVDPRDKVQNAVSDEGRTARKPATRRLKTSKPIDTETVITAPKPRIFTPAEQEAMRTMSAAGTPYVTIGELYGISEHRVKAMVEVDSQDGGIPLPF